MTSKIAKDAKKVFIVDLYNTLDKKKDKGGRLPHGCVNEHIKAIQAVCPSIIRHDVNNELRRRATRQVFSTAIVPTTTDENQVLTVITEAALAIPNNPPRKLLGRPVGSTSGIKVIDEMKLVAVKK